MVELRGKASMFNPSQFIKEFGGVLELDKATEYYTKGKVKEFKDLIGAKYKAIRKNIVENLRRNNKIFIDPAETTTRWSPKYEKIKEFIDDYKKKNNGRLPNKAEVAAGTGYARQGAVMGGEDKGLYELSKKVSPESSKSGALKRGILQTKTAETATIPVLKTGDGGRFNLKTNPYTHIIWPDKKIGNKTYKQAFIDDLKLRYRYPAQSVEAAEAGVLDAEGMMKKYGFKTPTTVGNYIHYINKLENIDGTFPIKSSEAKLLTEQEYRNLLKKVQGKVFIKKGFAGTVGTGTHLQHALLKNPNLPITAENLVFIPKRMNTKHVRKLETLRNNITSERDLLLKNKPKNWIKGVEFLNNKGMEIPAATEGLIQFETIDHTGNRYVHKLGSEKYQLDVAGLNRGKLLKDYTKADWDTLRLNVDQARKGGSKIPIRSFRDTVQKVLNIFKDLTTPQKIKTAVALNCVAAAEGGRIGYALGTATIKCVNTKLTNEPVQSSMKLRIAEGVGKIRPAATNFLKLLGRGGVKAAPYAALAAVGAVAEPLVKQFRNDDPTTYLTDESQMKGMLLSMIEGETPKVDEEILKWQYPGLGAATAAGAIPGAGEVYKARRGLPPTKDFIGPMKKGVGPTRAALGLSGVLGKALGASFSPLAVAATLPLTVAAQRKGGTEWGDIATDPMNWMAPAFASTGAEMATRGIKNPMLLKALRLGVSPKALSIVSRRFGLPGLAVSAGLWGYDKWKNRSINDE